MYMLNFIGVQKTASNFIVLSVRLHTSPVQLKRCEAMKLISNPYGGLSNANYFLLNANYSIE